MHTHGRTIIVSITNTRKPMPIHTMLVVVSSLRTSAGYFWHHIPRLWPNGKSSTCPICNRTQLSCGKRNTTSHCLVSLPLQCPFWYHGISGTNRCGSPFGSHLICAFASHWTLPFSWIAWRTCTAYGRTTRASVRWRICSWPSLRSAKAGTIIIMYFRGIIKRASLVTTKRIGHRALLIRSPNWDGPPIVSQCAN